jgi:hypothetical protein
VRLLKMKKKYLAIALATGVALGAGGVAAAFFSAGGSGTGSATVGTPVPFKITVHTKPGVTGPGDPTIITFSVANTHTTPSSVYYGDPYVTERATNPVATIKSVKTSITHTHTVITSRGSPVNGCLSKWFTATASPDFWTMTHVKNLGTSALVAPHTNVRNAVTVHMTNGTTPTNGTNQDACEGTFPTVTLHVGP